MAARRPEEQAALRPLPPQSSEVCERTTRQVGQDCRFSFEGSLYSAPAECAGQRIALRVFPDRLCLYTREPIPRVLGVHSRVRQRGRVVEEPTQYAPLRRPQARPPPLPPAARAVEPAGAQLTLFAPFDGPVVHRPLTVYAVVGTEKEGGHA